MANQETQVNIFSKDPIPDGLSVHDRPQSETVRRGKEAVVIKVGNIALKWYAKFSGSNTGKLIEYAQGIDRDEKRLIDVGVKPEQLPNSSFVIVPYHNQPELFAIQPWEEGRLLKEISFFEVVRNQTLRQGLVDLYSSCLRAHSQYGRFPDLMGGETIEIGRLTVEDPRKFLWPLRTTNILIRENNPLLLDARFLNLTPGSFKYQVARFHHHVTKLFTLFLRYLD